MNKNTKSFRSPEIEGTNLFVIGQDLNPKVHVLPDQCSLRKAYVAKMNTDSKNVSEALK